MLTARIQIVHDKTLTTECAFDSLRADSSWTELDTLAGKCGFHHWTYTAVPQCRDVTNGALRVTTYPGGHVADCVLHDLYPSSPAVAFALRDPRPARFKTFRDSALRTRKLLSLLDLNRKYGVTSGVLLPLTNSFGALGVLTLAFDGTDRQLHDLWCTKGVSVTGYAREMNSAVLSRHSRSFLRDLLPGLTQRQNDVLRHLALGNSTTDIADDLGIRVDTVNKHVAIVKHRLGSKTTAHMTALAAQWGLL
jgi:DNA-binding CsgD family transcriptional regulator